MTSSGAARKQRIKSCVYSCLLKKPRHFSLLLKLMLSCCLSCFCDFTSSSSTDSIYNIPWWPTVPSDNRGHFYSVWDGVKALLIPVYLPGGPVFWPKCIQIQTNWYRRWMRGAVEIQKRAPLTVNQGCSPVEAPPIVWLVVTIYSFNLHTPPKPPFFFHFHTDFVEAGSKTNLIFGGWTRSQQRFGVAEKFVSAGVLPQVQNGLCFILF